MTRRSKPKTFLCAACGKRHYYEERRRYPSIAAWIANGREKGRKPISKKR